MSVGLSDGDLWLLCLPAAAAACAARSSEAGRSRMTDPLEDITSAEVASEADRLADAYRRRFSKTPDASPSEAA